MRVMRMMVVGRNGRSGGGRSSERPHSGDKFTTFHFYTPVEIGNDVLQAKHSGERINHSLHASNYFYRSAVRFVTIVTSSTRTLALSQQMETPIVMAAIVHFDGLEFLNTLVSLAVALILGTLIGAERQYRQRTAGLRTNALVALGAAAFVDLGMRLNGNVGATQVLAYIASGVGFLGAGVIIKEGANITGVNTAATIWCSAVTGAFSGADREAEALLMAIFTLAGNMLLRPLVHLIERAPIDERSTEAVYRLHVTVSQTRRDALRDLMIERLEAADYPVREIEELERGDSEVELIAVLTPTSADPNELDAVAADLEKIVGVEHASWTATTTE
jgi:putative Mg2+ transporter-C (MgtC) family protein